MQCPGQGEDEKLVLATYKEYIYSPTIEYSRWLDIEGMRALPEKVSSHHVRYLITFDLVLKSKQSYFSHFSIVFKFESL